jgi:predicted short-subunit dehydrogenase-like oxidoreductase (DUF2520 family)
VITRPSLGFIGAGKVGTVLARAWYAHGYQISAIHSRNPDYASHLAAEVGAMQAAQLVDAIAKSDLILFTVPDDAIAGLVETMRPFDLQSKAIIHTSGVHSLDVLQPLVISGAVVGSLHPAFPFANAQIVPEQLVGTVFALESQDESLARWLHELVSALGGQWITIPLGGKATYHAAMTIASNFTVTLYALAEKLLLDLGISRQHADAALDGLLSGTVNNLHSQGVPEALTGAFVRGDVQTISAHLTALRHDDAILEVYKALARLTLPLAEQRGTPAELVTLISHLLAEQKENAHA